MPIHSLFIFNSNSNKILYHCYYNNCKNDYNFGNSQQFTYKVNKNIEQYNKLSEKLIKLSQFRLEDSDINVITVVRRYGDLTLALSGYDDYDEYILIEAINTIRGVLEDVLECTQDLFNEKVFIDSENYGKFCVSMNDMISHGIIETFDVEIIGKYSKLKNF